MTDLLEILRQRCREAEEVQDHCRAGYVHALAIVTSRWAAPGRWIALLAARPELPSIPGTSPLAQLHHMLVGLAPVPIPLLDGLLRGFEALIEIGVPRLVVMRAVDSAALHWLAIGDGQMFWQSAFRLHLSTRGYSADIIDALVAEQVEYIDSVNSGARPSLPGK